MLHQHFILHKPVGVICQFVYTHKRKKILLGDLYNFPKGTMSIGRLDVHSEGLLLLTTDGKVSEAVRSKTVEKEYHVQVDGRITEEAIQRLNEGVEIGVDGKKYKTLPGKAKKLDGPGAIADPSYKEREARHGPTSWASIVVTEGKFRQVRKMTAAVGFPTLRLIRVRVGQVHIADLQVGEVRAVERFQLK